MFVISITALSCRTTYQLPNNIEKPVLVDNFYQNEVNLIIQDLRWRLWANDARYICGDISKMEFEKEKEKLLKLVNSLKGN